MFTTDKELYETIGAMIKENRVRCGMTQQNLADLCEIEKANISRIERGCTNVTLKTLYRISVSLNVPMRDLVDFKMND